MVKSLLRLLGLFPLPFTELLITLLLILLYVVSDGTRLPTRGQLWAFFPVRWRAHNSNALACLPPEIFDMILVYLDAEDVIFLRMVSMEFLATWRIPATY